MLGAVSDGWRLVQELRPAGVANRQPNWYSDTLVPGSWLATQHAKTRDTAGVLTLGVARQHIDAPVGLTFRGARAACSYEARGRGSQLGVVVLR